MSFLNELQKQRNKLKLTETVVTQVDGRRYVEKDSTKTSISPNIYGFVVDTKPDYIPILIADYVFIGSQDCTTNTVIESYNIKHVLSLGIQVAVTVNNSLPFIRKAVDTKENCLIHCNAGVSRTSMVAIAYLMHYKKMPFLNAYDLVKSKRPAIQPNDGFKKQLKVMKPGEII